MCARILVLVIQHTKRLRHIAICGRPAVKYFSTLSHKRNDFRGKIYIEHKMRVFCISEKFLILRRNGRDITNARRLSRKAPVLFWKSGSAAKKRTFVQSLTRSNIIQWSTEGMALQNVMLVCYVPLKMTGHAHFIILTARFLHPRHMGLGEKRKADGIPALHWLRGGLRLAWRGAS